MFTTPDQAKAFLLAGNARMTVVSKATGTRFTYRVRRCSRRRGSTGPTTSPGSSSS